MFIARHACAQDPLIISDHEPFVADIQSRNIQGVLSGAHLLLFDALNGPNNLVFLPSRRAIQSIDDNTQPVCMLFRLANEERRAKYLFSQPLYVLLGQKLYQQENATPIADEYLNEQNEVTTLAGLFEAKPNARLLYLPVRSYGDELDQLISQIPPKHLINSSINQPHSSLSKMFFAGRAEFTIMYPGEVHEYRKQNPLIAYRSYQIQFAPQLIFGSVMCNKHPASSEYIAKVNKNLPSLQAYDDLLALHLKYNEESEAERITKAMQILKRMNTAHLAQPH